MKNFTFSILFFASIIGLGHAAKILVFSPKMGRSHVTFIGKIADIVSKSGHDVVVYQPILDENITTTGTKYARVIERPRDFSVEFTLDDAQKNVWSIEGQSLSKTFAMVGMMRQTQTKACKNSILDDKIMNQLLAENFTLAIGEPFDTCYYALLEKLGIKNYITAFAGNDAGKVNTFIGVPSTPSFVPGMNDGHPPLSYLQRAKNLFMTILMQQYLFPQMLAGPIDQFGKEVFGDHFDVFTKMSESTLVFVNGDEHLSFPSPTSHKIIYTGGMGQGKPKPLEKKLEEILNASKKGVVLVSFGSVAQSSQMPDVLKKKFLETFAQFPGITFLWKYEKDEDNIAHGYDNVITGKWLPQTDLLAHPKLLAFISHGGANSIMEAHYTGVPIICIPLFADQHRNAELVLYHKTGLIVQKPELLEGKLYDAIEKITTDQSFKSNAERVSKLIHAKPMSADERIIQYTNFAADFGFDNNLDMYGRHLNFMQYYCLDIILPFLGVVFVILYAFYRILKLVLRKVLSLIVIKSKVE